MEKNTGGEDVKPDKRRKKKKLRRKAKGHRVEFVDKKPGVIRCSCGAIISRSDKRPNRPFKNLCVKCMRERIREGQDGI